MTTKEDIDALKEVVDSWANQPEFIASFIQWNNRAHKYSEWNRMWIRAQRPDATLCMGYNDWLAVGRKATGKGIGIKVFYPKIVKVEVERNGETVEDDRVRGYGFTHTYDISNTVSVDPDNDEYEKLIAELAIPERSYDELKSFVGFIAEATGITLLDAEMNPESMFAVNHETQTVTVNNTLSEAEQVLATTTAIVALTITHKGTLGLSHMTNPVYAGNVSNDLYIYAGSEIDDFRTLATTWAIADRFGVDVTGQTQLMLGTPRIDDDEPLNKVLLDVVRSLKMFEQLESGVPYEWAQAYVNATLNQDSESVGADEEA